MKSRSSRVPEQPPNSDRGPGDLRDRPRVFSAVAGSSGARGRAYRSAGAGAVVDSEALKWLAAKTKLLICAGVTADSGGAAIAECAKTFIDFVKQSNGLFKELRSATESQQRAAELQEVIQRMQSDVARMQLSAIPGSATPQRYAQAFDHLCTQVRDACLAR